MFDPLSNKIMSEDMEHIYRSKIDFERLRGKSIYITGAAGMIASYFVYFLIWLNENKGYRMTIYAGIRSKEKALKRFGRYTEREYFHIINTDVNSPVPLDRDVDFLVHAASLASPQYYGGQPVETMLPNVVGTYELLRFAQQHRVESMLFFSSNTVYGEAKGKGISEDAVGLLDHYVPGSVYGESKRCGEALCGAYFREYGVPVKIARLSHTYGPTLDLERDKRAFSEFVRNIIKNEDIILKSEGLEKRAFCYLSDATDMLLRVLLYGQNGEAYNVVNEKAFVSIRELAETLTALFPEKGLKVVYQKRFDEGYVPLSQTSDIVCSMKKIVALGAEPSVDIREGFERTIRFLSEQG